MKSLEELQALRSKMRTEMGLSEDSPANIRVVVGMATCGIAAGARPVYDTLNEEVKKRALGNVIVSQTGCVGICQFEPVIEITTPGKEKVTYVKVTAEMAARIVEDHLVGGQIVAEYTIGAQNI